MLGVLFFSLINDNLLFFNQFIIDIHKMFLLLFFSLLKIRKKSAPCRQAKNVAPINTKTQQHNNTTTQQVNNIALIYVLRIKIHSTYFK